MLAKRIVPCLDVKDGKVVKGVKFRDHRVMGDIVELAQYYCESGADELVFYDITASCEDRAVSWQWVERVAKFLDIPFCVAGGIGDEETASAILHAGADKISVNSPALANPNLIDALANRFGSQCVVVGIDSKKQGDDYVVHQYTGDVTKTTVTPRLTEDWVIEVQQRGAGEIVLNCMDQDGVRKGYDREQLTRMRAICRVPLIASGGAGTMQDFANVFLQTNVDAALAASVFHSQQIDIMQLKQFLQQQNIVVRL